MKTTPVIYTLDYEIFGDGSGSVHEFQIDPTYELADVLASIGARMTVFVEYGQIAFYQEHSGHGFYRRRLDAICDQLKDLAGRGHDIQLHLHPTWIGAKINADDLEAAPTLNLNQDDISNIDEAVALDWIKRGKKFLETLLSEFDNYRCIAFRAGAFTATRQRQYLSLLRSAGLTVDSSVVPGAYLSSHYGKFDFRSVKKIKPYRVKDSLLQADGDGDILEIPIATQTGLMSTLRYKNPLGAKTRELAAKNYKSKLTDRGKGRVRSIISKLLRGYAVADYNFIDSENLYRIFESRKLEHRYGEPFVMLGHSKTSYFLEEIRKFRHLLEEKEEFRFTTISEYHTKCDV